MIKWNDSFYLNKKPFFNERNELVARPNSRGLRLFFEKNMKTCLLIFQEKKFYRY